MESEELVCSLPLAKPSVVALEFNFWDWISLTYLVLQTHHQLCHDIYANLLLSWLLVFLCHFTCVFYILRWTINCFFCSFAFICYSSNIVLPSIHQQKSLLQKQNLDLNMLIFNRHHFNSFKDGALWEIHMWKTIYGFINDGRCLIFGHLSNDRPLLLLNEGIFRYIIAAIDHNSAKIDKWSELFGSFTPFVRKLAMKCDSYVSVTVLSLCASWVGKNQPDNGREAFPEHSPNKIKGLSW